MGNTVDSQALMSLALDEARRLGADQAEVAVSQDTGLSTTARLGDVENLEYTNDRGFGITVFQGSRKGNASTSDLSEPAIREAVAKACGFATRTAEDPYAGLADESRMCTDIPDLDLDHPWAIEAPAAIDLAIECEAAALAYDKRIRNSEGATVGSNRGIRSYANTHGFLGSYAKTSHSVSCVVLGEADGDMQRDYYYSASRDASELESPSLIGETAARRAVERLGAVKPQTRTAPVLFLPELAKGFIGHAMSAVSGGAQYRKSTFLLDALGETVFPEWLSIDERPHIAKAMASAPYDGEGVATYDRSVFSDGVLQGYLLSSYSARRLGLESTANAGGAQNLVVSANASGFDAMLRQMDTGLIVEELIGHGVNPVTGDYSRGAVGHWVEGGEVRYPVHEVTIAGNLKELYRSIVAVGEDRDTRGGIRCGSLLVDGMTIAGA
ncbi:MAG: metalloprotease PmbA [Pseudomonadota bacterium]